MKKDAQVWLIAVGYQDPAATERFVNNWPHNSRIRASIVENSSTPIESEMAGAFTNSGLEFHRFVDNPGYYGAASRLASQYPERLKTYSCVVVCNLDLHFDIDLLIERAQHYCETSADQKWIMAPRIIEEGYRFEANPSRAQRPTPFKAPRAFGLSSRFPLFALLSVASDLKRRFSTNKMTSHYLGKPFYLPHGSFIAYGNGYFTCGGVIPNVPLTNEEFAVAEIAHFLECPIYLDNKLVVTHRRGVTTKGYSLRSLRQRFAFFSKSAEYYGSWNPNTVVNNQIPPERERF